MELRLDLQHKRFDTAPIAQLFTQGENNVDVITLRGAKMYGALDASQLTFILRAVSEKDTLVEQQLTAATDGDDLVLTWTVTEDFTAVSGLLHLKLRGIDTAGNVVLKLGAEPIYIQTDIQGDYAPPQDVLTKALNDMRGQVAAAEEQAGIAKTEADRLVQAGANFKVLGFYLTLDALQTAVPNPARGDAYGVGDNPVHAYVWSGTEWQQGQALGIDLTAYYTKTDVDGKLAGKASAEQGVKADNALTLGERIELKNIDLNNLKTVGSYAAKNSSDMPTISNCPFTEAFSLDISWSLGNNGYITQKAVLWWNGRTKIRTFNPWDGNGTWGEWREYAMGETLASDKTIYVRKTGNDETGDGSTEKPYLTVAKAVDYANRVNGSFVVTIVIGDGTYDENVLYLLATDVRMVKLISESANPNNVYIKINNNIQCYVQDCNAEFHNITFSPNSLENDFFIKFEYAKGHIYNCKFIQTSSSRATAIVSESSSQVFANSCIIDNPSNAFYVGRSSIINCVNASGYCKETSYIADGGVIMYGSSTLTSATVKIEINGGLVRP